MVVDRYAFSGVAYTSSKDIPLAWCKNPDIGLPAPDSVIFLEMKSTGEDRKLFGDERYETKEFQKKVIANFQK